MDWKTLSRYINYNFVAQAITSALSGVSGKITLTKAPGVSPVIHARNKTILQKFNSYHYKSYHKAKSWKSTKTGISFVIPVNRNEEITIEIADTSRGEMFIINGEYRNKKMGYGEQFMFVCTDRTLTSTLHNAVKKWFPHETHKAKVGELPNGLTFALKGHKFKVGFQYDLSGKLKLDLFSESGHGVFDLSVKADRDKAVAFILANANVTNSDPSSYTKNAKAIISEIAKELAIANKKIKTKKPDRGGERAPENYMPQNAVGPFKSRIRRPKVKPKKPVVIPPQMTPTEKPGRPTKIQRMNKRGFDVVEKRSITYTKKSPSAKLTGVKDTTRSKTKVYPAISTKPAHIFVSLSSIKFDGTNSYVPFKGKKYRVLDDMDGAYFIKVASKVLYLYDYSNGRAITEHYFDDMSGIKKIGNYEAGPILHKKLLAIFKKYKQISNLTDEFEYANVHGDTTHYFYFPYNNTNKVITIRNREWGGTIHLSSVGYFSYKNWDQCKKELKSILDNIFANKKFHGEKITGTKYPTPKLFKPTKAQTTAAAKRLVKQSLQPTAKQLAARAKFTKMVKARAAASKKKVGNITYKQKPERLITGLNDRNWWAGLGKVPKKGKVNWLMVPEDKVSQKIEDLTMASFVPRIKVAITRGKKFDKPQQIRSADSAANIIRRFFSGSQLETQEYGGALFMDKQNKVLGVYVGFVGGIDSTVLDQRLIFAAALSVGASAFMLFHNHPSGSLAASSADKKITLQFNSAGNLMDVDLIDHIILTNKGYYSLRENGDLLK